MFLVQLAFRNLFRNFRRTVITALAVVFGVAVQIFGWGLVDGLDENFIRASAWTTTGDIVLRPVDYPVDGLTWPIEEAQPMPAGLAGSFEGDVAGRTLFQARLVKGAEASRVLGLAYDAETDPTVFPREHWVLDGAWPKPGALEVVVGDALARLLQVKLGDMVIVEARTFEGSLNALSYQVTGIVHTDNAQLDNLGLWIERQAGADLLLFGDRYTHISLRVDGDPDVVKGSLVAPGWVGATVREEVADLLAVNTIRRAAIMLLVFVVMLIAGLGIANTVIMAAYERVREIGTLLAMGMRQRDVAAMFLIEGAVMGLTAGVVGALMGSAGVMYLEDHGILLGSQAAQATRSIAMSSLIYTKFRIGPVLFALGYSAVVAVLASIFPARFAAGLNPADAVRAD